MKEHRINDSTTWKNNVFFDLPFWREILVDPKTSQRIDIHNIEKNTKKTNLLLENIRREDRENNIEILTKQLNRKENDVKNLMEEIIRNEKNYHSIISNTNREINENLQDIGTKIGEGVIEINHMLEQILGHEIPTNIPLNTIGRHLTREGKKTLIGLASKGAIRPEKLSELLPVQLIYFLKEGIDTKKAKKLQEAIMLTLQGLKKGTSEAHQKYRVLLEDRSNMASVSKSEAERIQQFIIIQTQKYENLVQNLMNEDELELLDIAIYSKQKNIGALVEEGIINPGITSLFLKYGIINGSYANIIGNIFSETNGSHKPQIELFGIAGIQQHAKANTLNQASIIDNQKHIIHQNILSLNNQDIGLSKQERGLLKQDTTNEFLKTINKTINIGNTNISKIGKDNIKYLGQINESIDNGTTILSKRLGQIDKNIVYGFGKSIETIKGIKDDILYGFADTTDKLKDIHNELTIHSDKMDINNKYVEYATNILSEISEGITSNNNKLDYIGYQIGKSNELFHESNNLLEINNKLHTSTNQMLEVSNELLLSANHELENINRQITYGTNQISSILLTIGGELIENLQSIENILQNMYNLDEEYTKRTLEKMQEQTKIMNDIKENINKLNEINANHFYKNAITWISSNNIDDAIKDLEKALDLNSTHIGSQYSISILYYKRNMLSEAEKHIEKTIKLCEREGKYDLLSEVYTRGAKIALKGMNIPKSKILLDNAILLNENNIEAHTIKTYIQQKQKKIGMTRMGSQIIFDILFDKNKENNIDISIDLRPFNKQIKKIVSKAIHELDIRYLLKIFKTLQKAKYKDHQKDILYILLQYNPQGLIANKIKIDRDAISDKDIENIVTKLKNKNIKNAEKYYYRGYILLPIFDHIKVYNIIKRGLLLDPLRTIYKSTQDISQKEKILNNIKDKLYGIYGNQQIVRNIILEGNKTYNEQY